MKKLIVLLCALSMSFMIGGCKDTSEEVANTQKKITVNHSLGSSEVVMDPQKIVVLDLAALDTLDAFGLGDRIIGIPKASSVHYLKSYKDDKEVQNVGSLKEVDMEALYALQPDVIFIGGRLEGEYERLSEIAPTLSFSIDHSAGYMQSFKQNVEEIATMFGLQSKAEELIGGFHDRIATIKEYAQGNKAIVSMVSSGSLSTLGSDTRGSLITNELGFENIANDVNTTHGDQASFEYVLEKNPDYIFVLDRDTAIESQGANVAQDVMNNDIISKTVAYQNDQIVYLTPDVWYLSEGGITATDMMLQDIEKIIK